VDVHVLCVYILDQLYNRCRVNVSKTEEIRSYFKRLVGYLDIIIIHIIIGITVFYVLQLKPIFDYTY
jgi:hypothetical protein